MFYVSDLEADSIKQDEISDVIVSPGEPLILRCRRKFSRDSTINWQHEGKVLVDKTNKVQYTDETIVSVVVLVCN